MTNWARSIVITVLVLVLAAGGYMAWNDQPGGQMVAASRFEQRSRNLPDARRISLLYPGSDQVWYEGEYQTCGLPAPELNGPELPNALARNIFIEPIYVKAVCEVVGEQRYTADGQGRSYDLEGHLTYDGSWRNGYRNGYGIEFFADGRERYSGEYVNGLKQGSGRLYVLENGSYYLLYEGTLDYECFNGPGTMYSVDGQVWFSGCWYYGEPLM